MTFKSGVEAGVNARHSFLAITGDHAPRGVQTFRLVLSAARVDAFGSSVGNIDSKLHAALRYGKMM